MADGVAGPDARELAAEILRLLTASGMTVAAAESLTGGLVAGALTDMPGSSTAFRGGVVAYATELKAQILGVDSRHAGRTRPGLRPGGRRHGRRRAKAARRDDRSSDHGRGRARPRGRLAAGTVHIAVSLADDTVVRTMALAGNRDEVRRLTVERVLGLLLGRLREA